VEGVAAADLLVHLAPEFVGSRDCSITSITSTTWSHEACPEVRLVLRGALEMRRQIATDVWWN
jgi:hypothetical protein